MIIDKNASYFIDRIREVIDRKYKLLHKNELSFDFSFDDKSLYIQSKAADARGNTEEFVGLFSNNLFGTNISIDRPVDKKLGRYNRSEDSRYVSCNFGPAIEMNNLIDVQNGVPSSLINDCVSDKIHFSYFSNTQLYLLLYRVSETDDYNISNSNIILNNIIKIANSIILLIQDEYDIEKVRVSSSRTGIPYINTDGNFSSNGVTLFFEGKFINNPSRKIYITIDVSDNILKSENIFIYEDKVDISGLEPSDYTTPEMIEDSLAYTYEYCIIDKVANDKNVIVSIPMSNLDEDSNMCIIKEGYNMYCNNRYRFDIEFKYEGAVDDISCDIDSNKFARLIKFKLS